MEHEPIHADLLIPRHTHPLNQARLVAQRAQRRHQPAIPVLPLPHIVRRRPINIELGIIKDLTHPLDRLGPEAASRPSPKPSHIPPRHPPTHRPSTPSSTTLNHTITITTPPPPPPLPPVSVPLPLPPHIPTPIPPPTRTPLTLILTPTKILPPLIAQRLETVARLGAQVIVEIKVRVAVLLVDAAALGDDLRYFCAAEGGGGGVGGCGCCCCCRRRGGRGGGGVGGLGLGCCVGGEGGGGEEGCCWGGVSWFCTG